MHPTDEALAAAYIERDDENAFRTLVERHQERIFGYLLGMVRNREVANDLFQETFLRVISAMRRERGSYERQGRWLAWVMTIARNSALDHLRRRKKWQDVDNDGEETFWERMPDDMPIADDRLREIEQARLLEVCIRELPPVQREVVLLRHETDLTFREIADLTGVSINTALGRMRYALINLRRMMSDSLSENAERIGTA
jgi:RNA polymerase sigma-70 factor (ECF subfamily)